MATQMEKRIRALEGSREGTLADISDEHLDLLIAWGQMATANPDSAELRAFERALPTNAQFERAKMISGIMRWIGEPLRGLSDVERVSNRLSC
ncbi:MULTISPECIES: hypothetical protein [Asticcacaulis]|uniref:hypothetical protein n=1 Tax=Asticcacaulis TaxID=76890 RepID=UPI001AE26609|nr:MULTISPECIES: hypothetical protein [Asticcacaulis]MBP2159554.1 hypothetical protein [Asticcacaulis solisilvae]MDR6800619.1 hypothetical protein [Asticcacaulis sp. BE141]